MSEDQNQQKKVLIKIVRDDGIEFGDSFDVSTAITPEELGALCKVYDDATPQGYGFYVKDHEITICLQKIIELLKIDVESVIEICVRPRSSVRIRPATRCSSSLPGHTAAITTLSFSPDGRNLATGSGDTTIRLWDLNTETPMAVLEGHNDWVLALAWSPTCQLLATGDKCGSIILWNADNGKAKFPPLKGHKQWITYISWEPLHLYKDTSRFVSSSKDGLCIIWDATTGCPLTLLSSHRQNVSCVRWGGEGLIYSSSRDLTIVVWNPESKIPAKILKEHSHWVNYLTLNTDYLLHSSCFDYQSTPPIRTKNLTISEMIGIAKDRYCHFRKSNNEMMVSCSDDFTMILWRFKDNTHTSTRITGHKAPINHVCFSPDGRILASASFDKSIKLWNGLTGSYIATLKGHVSKVYQLAWSLDCRMLCSCSADSTLKIWDVTTRKLLHDLTGHDDEIYAVDWSNDGQRVASGGRDKLLKLWKS